MFIHRERQLHHPGLLQQFQHVPALIIVRQVGLSRVATVTNSGVGMLLSLHALVKPVPKLNIQIKFLVEDFGSDNFYQLEKRYN